MRILREKELRDWLSLLNLREARKVWVSVFMSVDRV